MALTLEFIQDLPQGISVVAQDLLSKQAIDITHDITINNNTIAIPGTLIDQIGTRENEVDDISVPGLVMKVFTH